MNISIKESTIKTLNVIDLFCGCGGMSKGLTDAGLNIIVGIDIWDKAVESYNKNFKHKAYCEDLTKLSPEKFNELYNKDNKNIDILVGGPPCFIAGTQVLTYDGYKKIEDVILEDRLLTHTGKFQKIVNLQRKKYTGNIYELDINFHPEIINCTEEHPFYVRTKNKIWDNTIGKYKIIYEKPLWKIAKELTTNDYLGMVINSNEIIPEFTLNIINDQHKEKIILDKLEYWYMMGYYVCYGLVEKKIKKKRTKYNIKFLIYDKQVLKKLQKVLPLLREQYNECNSYQRVVCVDNVWIQILRMFGTYEKKIPEWVQNAPKEFIIEFIHGYIISQNHISTTSSNIAFDIQRLFFKLGQIISINKSDSPAQCKLSMIKSDNPAQCYLKKEIIYTYYLKHKIHQNVKSFNENDNVWIEPLKINERKIKEEDVISFNEYDYIWIKPLKITKREVREENVYNFEVLNDNSYIVENTIVHNCQSYSIAGKRDKNDPRNALFMEYIKYLDYYKPKAFIMENVIGILSKKTINGEKVIDIIMEQLNRNYNCIINKLYASDFEVPQNRRRTIIIGIRKDLNILPKNHEPIIKSIQNRIPVKTILIPKEYIDKKYYLSEKALTGIEKKREVNKEKGFGFGAQMLDFEKPSYTIPARYWKDGYDALVKYNDNEIRRLTITELKRIQSFPDDYIINGSNKDIIMQIGNAVACRFAYHLGKYIINTLQ